MGDRADIPADHLAANVRAIRAARGLSQQQIARLAGVPRATWSHLESETANPTLHVLCRVADALQVRLDELLAAPRSPVRHLRAAELPVRARGPVSRPPSAPSYWVSRMMIAPSAIGSPGSGVSPAGMLLVASM